jgi:predicted RNase H-like nuclease (RuvC/YqgF family)
MNTLPFEVAKLEDVEEAHRALYGEVDKDGTRVFRINVKGAVSEEFRDNNRTLHTENQTLKDQVAANSHELETLKTQLAEAGDKGKKNDKEKSDMEERVASLEKANADALERAAAAESRAARSMASEKIKTAATTAGAKKDLLDNLATDALNDGWQIGDNGDLERRRGETLVMSEESAGKPQAIGEYLNEVAAVKPSFFGSTEGDGADNEGDRDAGKRVITRAEAATGNFIEEIHKGEVIVR